MGLLFGTRGWQHTAWQGDFYPEDLPQDWFLGFYANEFRAVCLTVRELVEAERDELAGWHEDVPDNFLFWLELGPGLMAHYPSPERLCDLLQPLNNQIGGFFLSTNTTDQVAGYAEWTEVIEDKLGVNQGCFAELSADWQDNRQLRTAIEQLAANYPDCDDVMLCLPASKGSWQRLQDARVIAEMLGL